MHEKNKYKKQFKNCRVQNEKYEKYKIKTKINSHQEIQNKMILIVYL